MLYKLTFKKAFGLRTIQEKYDIWLLELGNTECNFLIHKKEITVKRGEFGKSSDEKSVIGLFYHSDERDTRFINEVITLDISLNVDIKIPEAIQERVRNENIDSLVTPFIKDAFNAANRFVDAARTTKYRIKRGSDDWRKGNLILIPELTEAEFKTYLFYELQNSKETYVGCFSEGRMSVSNMGDNLLIAKKMQEIVQNEIPFNGKLIVKAWEYMFQDDYRNCVIYAAMALELTIIESLRKYFISKSIASDSRIDRFLDDVSKRFLCTVVLGMIGIGNKTLRDKIAKVFDIRNGLVHGKKKKIKKAEAETALNDSEQLLEILDNLG
jgi:hypothetical protein